MSVELEQAGGVPRVGHYVTGGVEGVVDGGELLVIVD